MWATTRGLVATFLLWTVSVLPPYESASSLISVIGRVHRLLRRRLDGYIADRQARVLVAAFIDAPYVASVLRTRNSHFEASTPLTSSPQRKGQLADEGRDQ